MVNLLKKFGKACVLVSLYTDDMFILGTNIEVINKKKIMLTNNFDLKDIGEANLILGTKISRIPAVIN